MRGIIIGCRYNGTTSLEKYLKDKGWDIIRDELIFDSISGPDIWRAKHQDRTPIIIISKNKNHLFDFKLLLKNWEFANPILFQLEQLKTLDNFPKLNEDSTIRGFFAGKHLEHLGNES